MSADGTVVVGNAFPIGGSVYQPFRWDACAGMELLPSPHLGLGTYVAGASGDGSVIVADSIDWSNGTAQAHLWMREKGWKQLPTPPLVLGGTAGISDDGNTVVLDANDTWLDHEGLRWTRQFGVEALSQPQYSLAWISNISGDGNVTYGGAEVFPANGPDIWNGPVKWIGTVGPSYLNVPLPSQDWWVVASNTDGSVAAGSFQNHNEYEIFSRRPAIFRSGLIAQKLPIFAGTDAGWANDVSGDGQIVVGLCGVADGGPYFEGLIATKAFMWSQSDGLKDIQQVLSDSNVLLSGVQLRNAQFISRDGTTMCVEGDLNGNEASFIVRLPRIIRKVDTLSDYNRVRHETSAYKPDIVDGLVFRRGKLIEIDVELFKPFVVSPQALSLRAVHRFNPDPSAIGEHIPTSIDIPLYVGNVPAGVWACEVVAENDGPMDATDASSLPTKVVSLAVLSPPNAPVGEYEISVIAKSGATEETLRLGCNAILLFNPMPGQDQVAMPEKNKRDEYALAPDGWIWGRNRSAPKQWNYAPFSKEVLRGTLKLLDKLDSADRSNPYLVSRHLSANVNSHNDDSGLLIGEWRTSKLVNPPPGVILPDRWSNSADIFRKFLDSGAVSWGQCWVFGGTLTSACRTLGIPARPVTNYLSAHDVPPYNHQMQQKWIQQFDAMGNPAGWKLAPSIWNFHVWTEAWLGGEWNVVDATPQEQSDGLYQLGPAPVAAVKSRSDSTLYNVAFVVSEVDADVWRQQGTPTGGPTGPYPKPAGDLWQTNKVGFFISTKSVGSTAVEDITDAYKTHENGPPSPLTTADPISVSLPSELGIGVGLNGNLVIANESEDAENFVVSFSVRATTYTNEQVGIVAPSGPSTITVSASSTASVPIIASWQNFRQFFPVADYWIVDFTVTRVGDGANWFGSKPIPVSGLPVLVTTTAGNPIPIGTEFSATVTCTNSSGETLHNAAVRINGNRHLLINGLTESDELVLGDLAPGQSSVIQRTFRAVVDGYASVSATFSADSVVSGSAGVQVNVARCPGDLTEDTVVDDSDFTRFVAAYNLLDCNSHQMDARCLADLNGDGVVDDQDFVLFIVAYNTLVCG